MRAATKYSEYVQSPLSLLLNMERAYYYVSSPLPLPEPSGKRSGGPEGSSSSSSTSGEEVEKSRTLASFLSILAQRHSPEALQRWPRGMLGQQFRQHQETLAAAKARTDASADLPKKDAQEESLLKALFKMEKIILEERTGGGFYGDIYRAYDECTEKKLVIKMVQWTDRYNAASWLSEQSVLRRILHRNVLGTNSKGVWMECGDRRYFCIEVEDKDLRRWEDFVSQESQTMAAIVRVVKDVALGLRSLHVHRFHFIHRDLHTGNVMVFPDNRGIIIDMGTVLPLNGDEGYSTLQFDRVSKVPVPEIEGGYGMYSELSDIFHFGVFLWDSMMMVNPRVLDQASAKFLDMVQDLIQDCIELEPRRRPRSVEDVLKRLDSALWALLPDSDQSVETPIVSFHEACERGHVAQVIRYLKSSQSLDIINEQNCIGQTPLFLAMENGHALVVQELLRNGARLDIRSHADRTGLDQAFYHGRREVVDLVIERYNDGGTVLSADYLFLSCCYHSSFLDMVEGLLRSEKVDVNVSDTLTLNTGLHTATKLCQFEVVRLLLAYGADPAMRNRDGWTPLHLACLHGDVRLADQLISSLHDKELVNAQERLGRTPYMLATVVGSSPVMELLRQSGADVHITDTNGFTANDLAAKGDAAVRRRSSSIICKEQ